MNKILEQLTVAIEVMKQGILDLHVDTTLSFREKDEKIKELQILIRSCLKRQHVELLQELENLKKVG